MDRIENTERSGKTIGESESMQTFDGKKVFITGGSSGIGLATARLLAGEGADVCIVARNIHKLERARRIIKACTIRESQQVIGMPIDVTKRLHIRKCAQKLMERWGHLDLLINNAGVSRPGLIQHVSDEVWDRVMEINAMGTINTTMAFLPYLIRQKSGHIANVASILGFMGLFGTGPYTASKFAVAGFSECLRQDMLPYGIRVSVFYPPDTETPMLTDENKIKPAETRILSGSIRPISAEQAARYLLKGIRKNRFTIVPGPMAKITHLLQRFAPGILRYVLDQQLKAFWKKRKKQSHAGYEPEYSR